ncbi:hypothetical protein RQP46_004462 [Phenoliferia psychrophenolica]
MTGRRAPSRVWLALASVVCIHLLCWKAAAPLRHSHALALQHSPHSNLAKRAFEPAPPYAAAGDSERASQHADEPAESDATSLIDYMGHWGAATPQTKPFVFAAMVLWLVFLFAFVGITASDFFCPNLSTIASRLGLSESVAGVTFLAFSNGSPDVFSTFAALRRHSGSLAIGELIGAASFIVSVVAGTMCVIQPFKVARHTFLRDVGFFTVAVTFTLTILWDSHIHGWEALCMVALYVIYVIVVAVGSWWMARRERQREVLRLARSEYASDVSSYYDDPMMHTPGGAPPTPRSYPSTPAHNSRPSTPTSGGYPFPSSPSPTAPSTPATLHPHMHHSLDQDTLVSLAERGTTVTLTRTRSGSVTNHSPTVRRPKTRSTVRPSLLGAIEFRDVVNSLRADSSARTLAVFGGGSGREEHHGHASVVGAEGFYDPGALGSKAQTRPGRSVSHSGAQRPDLGSEETSTPFTGSRSASWTAESAPRSAQPYEPNTGNWGEAQGEEGEGEGGPLIDLSAGADNPWRASWGNRQTLKVDIPAYASSAATSPRTLRRKSSATSDTSIVGKPVPSIRLTTDAGDETVLSSQPKPGFFSIRHRRGYLISRAVFLALFPSLQDFRAKSFVGKATAILCVPAILVLNLTLPVVDIEEDDCVSIENRETDEARMSFGSYHDEDDGDEGPAGPNEGLLIDTTDEAQPHEIRRGQSEPNMVHQARLDREAAAQGLHSRVLPHAEEDVPSPWATPLDLDHRNSFTIARTDSNIDQIPSTPSSTTAGMQDSKEAPAVDLVVHSNVLTRWLTAVQCTLGPVFCITALFADDLTWWYPLAALGGGLCIGSFAFYCFEDHRHPGRVVLCFVGFFVAMVWILMIVNEVVGVLLTIGHIFGLSDAILGLTIFAMGNSLGDLVANATVARMGFPSMAIAACFGGPMLNILLGVGLSGSYLIFTSGNIPLHVEMGRTLLVSGAGLLAVLIATLIAVPMNGYMMSKRMGWTLIGAYVVVLSINILVEVFL